MNPLHGTVEAAFASTGALAAADPHYTPREVQLAMALGVAQALDERSVLVVEAGTGVGKTFAYLVPTLLSGMRALVSTATKSLQDQLFLRDIPRLRDALQRPVTVALLKGRSSYLCLHRLGHARQPSAGLSNDRWAQRTLAKIEHWSQITVSGDLAELEGLDESSQVLPWVTSSRDNCLGTECPEHRQCHVLKARREAMLADVVVVNHHLFFADMALRDTGVAELLPSVEVALFDEAHQLAEVGVQFLGTTLGSAQAFDFARDMRDVGLQQARGLGAWAELAAACEGAARDLRLAASSTANALRGTLKVRWSEHANNSSFSAALQHLNEVSAAAMNSLQVVMDLSPDFVKLVERAQRLAQLAQQFSGETPPSHVRWIDVSAHHVRLVESPLDIREALQQQLCGQPKAWIFTSATLGDDEQLTWFTESAGLERARTLRLGSPFNYADNARLYIPHDFPKPNEPGHPGAVAALAARCARALQGRTFVLTTTLKALREIGAALRCEFAKDNDDLEVLMQGETPKRQLLQKFLAQPGSVLVGSQSFWEGIDVPGDALQCVLIDKLPFPPPHDPLVEAQTQRLESEGRNPFNDFFVAEAAVALKQGAGRLIRSETDRGLLVVCDSRMASMSYGKRLRDALPPMTRLATEAQALDWLHGLSCSHKTTTPTTRLSCAWP